jgi:hypothetical protein
MVLRSSRRRSACSSCARANPSSRGIADEVSKRRKRTRIFQGMRAPEIIDAVLEGAGISARWQLLRDHAVRAFVT